MKTGMSPIVLGGAVLVPEHPDYWDVPATYAAAVEQLVEAGRVEYEPAFARGGGGQFAVQIPAAPALPRKGHRR